MVRHTEELRLKAITIINIREPDNFRMIQIAIMWKTYARVQISVSILGLNFLTIIKSPDENYPFSNRLYNLEFVDMDYS